MFFKVSGLILCLLFSIAVPLFLIPAAFFGYAIYQVGKKRVEAEQARELARRRAAHNKAVRYFSS